MKRRIFTRWLAACPIVLLSAMGAMAAPDGNWVQSWASSPSLAVEKLPFDFWRPPAEIQGTVRYKMRVTAEGDALRIRLSAETLPKDVQIGAATIAPADAAGRIDTASMKKLSFAGAASARMPAGTPLLSDPVFLPVKAGTILYVTLHLPEGVAVPQADPLHVADVLAGPDRTVSGTLAGSQVVTGREIVSAILVRSARDARTIVTFGDSITDGAGATDPMMRGWPDQFAALLRQRGLSQIAVANAGIGGNRVLRNEVGEAALARFDRDALSVPGVTDIVLLEGINDLGLSGLANPRGPGNHPAVTAADLIAGYRQLIARAKARGLKIHGATLTPFLGSPFPGYATPAKEVIRQELNRWIRDSGEFDSVIDFDAALRDPANPQMIKPAFDSGDKLHPSDAGYRAMAEAAASILLK
ncbi:SGNH/GDSL hydrolase family protein [Niveispirillum sp. KHB5.9]|uniref:SGNH/GDSL hydrolase family protein n=1 Tax=Niveispirillum sp. KHB5.9 TaxID=3400269 RepID=UPI003A8457FA